MYLDVYLYFLFPQVAAPSVLPVVTCVLCYIWPTEATNPVFVLSTAAVFWVSKEGRSSAVEKKRRLQGR